MIEVVVDGGQDELGRLYLSIVRRFRVAFDDTRSNGNLPSYSDAAPSEVSSSGTFDAAFADAETEPCNLRPVVGYRTRSLGGGTIRQ